MVTTDRDRLVNDIADIIEEADFNWKCDGIQTEHISELELVELKLDDADAVVNLILGRVSDYLAEVL